MTTREIIEETIKKLKEAKTKAKNPKPIERLIDLLERIIDEF